MAGARERRLNWPGELSAYLPPQELSSDRFGQRQNYSEERETPLSSNSGQGEPGTVALHDTYCLIVLN